jgi:hypothetical protein
MEIVEAKMTESTIDRLRNMSVSKTKALEVSATDAQVVRVLISRLHHENKKVKYTTTKTDNGILVWRVK